MGKTLMFVILATVAAGIHECVPSHPWRLLYDSEGHGQVVSDPFPRDRTRGAHWGI